MLVTVTIWLLLSDFIQMSTMKPLSGTIPVVLGDQSIILNLHSMWDTYTCLVGFIWSQSLHIDFSLYQYHRQEIVRYIFLENSIFMPSLSTYSIQHDFKNNFVTPNKFVALKIDPELPINIHGFKNPFRTCNESPINIGLSKSYFVPPNMHMRLTKADLGI